MIPETDIKTLSKTLIDIIKEEEEEKIALKDMKMYLNKTNLSAEQKLKEYSNFSASLFNAKITAGLQDAQQYGYQWYFYIYFAELFNPSLVIATSQVTFRIIGNVGGSASDILISIYNN